MGRIPNPQGIIIDKKKNFFYNIYVIKENKNG